MMRLILALLVWCSLAGGAYAAAWPEGKGQTLAIVKYENGDSDRGFDAAGHSQPTTTKRDDELSLYIDHGLTDHLTLNAQFGGATDRQALLSKGQGPVELGLRYGTTTAAGAALAVFGDVAVSRNPGGHLQKDFEAGVLVGQSGTIGALPVFVEGQASRVVRQGLPDQVRLDLTLGANPSPNLTLLAQAYAGQADHDSASWVTSEISAVLTRGSLSLQAGWRRTVAGKETRLESGPTVAVWKRF